MIFFVIVDSKSKQSHLPARLKSLSIKDNLFKITFSIEAIESMFSSDICTNSYQLAKYSGSHASQKIQNIVSNTRSQSTLQYNYNCFYFHISSIGDIVGYPFSAAYCSTKFALEGLSESLSYELDQFGIKVILIEPALQFQFLFKLMDSNNKQTTV